MTGPFATAGADLDGELADIRAGIERLSSRLGRTIDQLAARVARLESEVRPQPELDPLVAGPPWPTDAIYRGAAPTQGAVALAGRPATIVTLRPRTEGSSSSDGHDVHVTLPERLTRYAWDVDLMLDAAMLDAVTWKFGGMAGFDGNWAAWPGGDSSAGAAGSSNSMERLVGQNTAKERVAAFAGFGVYCTFPTPVADLGGKAGVRADVGGAPAWVTNKGHTCHWEILDTARARWAHHRREVDCTTGTLRHLIDGDEVIALTGLPFPTVGMNRVYVSCMIGGSDASFLPRTPDRTGTLAYSGFELVAL